MSKTITIADAHSSKSPKQKLTIELMGGSPWFNYLWIDDVCYTIVKGDRVAKIKKTQ